VHVYILGEKGLYKYKTKTHANSVTDERMQVFSIVKSTFQVKFSKEKDKLQTAVILRTTSWNNISCSAERFSYQKKPRAKLITAWLQSLSCRLSSPLLASSLLTS